MSRYGECLNLNFLFFQLLKLDISELVIRFEMISLNETPS